MVSTADRPTRRLPVLAALGVFACLGLGAAAVQAQTGPGTPAGSPPAVAADNCAASTARIGSIDVTEFFGVRGGAAGFTQNFGATSGQPVARCIRLEVENPSPGDLLPVGGYVMTGFAFDPLASADQGAGMTGVQVFLDDPNQGGAILGQTSADASSPGGKGFELSSARGAAFRDQFAQSGFRLTRQVPSSAAGGQHAVFVLALSSAGRVGTVAVPVIVGNLTPGVPTRTP